MVEGDTANEVCNVIEADSTSFTIPSQLEWVGKTAEYLQKRAQDCGACDSERAGKMVIALHEALTNAIIHGNFGLSSELKEHGSDVFARAVAEKSADPLLGARRVKVRFDYDGALCSISICDEGQGFDYLSWIKALDQPESDQPSELASGRGILMMRALADQVEYSDAGRQVKMTWRAPAWNERRNETRQNWNELVRVLPVDADGKQLEGSNWEPAIGRNVSDGGLALIQGRPSTSQRVLIEIHEDGEPTYVSANVCQMTMLEDGLIQIGCRFREDPARIAAREIVSPPVIERLLDRMEHGPGPAPNERRIHRRVGFAATVKIRTTGGAFRNAFSRDLSRGGMAMLAPFKLPLGSAEILLPVQGEEDQLLAARVVRCQRVSRGVYDIGCQFV